MSPLVLTFNQTLQVVALAPCVFVILYLLVRVRRPRRIAIPVLYFSALACGFILPLLNLFPAIESGFRPALLFGDSLSAVLSFLLILQFVYGRPPPWYYWMILALPIIGGGSFIYLDMLDVGACLRPDLCIDATSAKTLYSLFASSLVFLWLIMIYSREALAFTDPTEIRRTKYYLIIALVLLNLALLALDLFRIANQVHAADAELAETILQLGFIYLVLSSMFRVFMDSELTVRHIPMLDEEELSRKIRQILEREKRYLEAGFNRETLARALGTNENYVSRVVNSVFGMSVTKLVNHYRIKEAQHRLRTDHEMRITDIAMECGFSSLPSFNRTFKKYTGKAPGEYRTT